MACLIAAWCRLAEGRAAAASELISSARQGWSPPGWLEHRLTLLEARVNAAEGDIQAAVAAAERGPCQRLPAAPPSRSLRCGWPRATSRRPGTRWTRVADLAGAAPEQVRLEGWLADARLSYETGDSARGRRSLEHALRLGKAELLRLPFAMERSLDPAGTATGP